MMTNVWMRSLCVVCALALAACGGKKKEGEPSASKPTPPATKPGPGPGPAPTPATPDQGLRAIEVSCDTQVSYALMSDGTVRGWGMNDDDAFGDGKKDEDSATPVEIPGLKDVVQIEAGRTLARRSPALA
jgi:hypothetical protein